MRIVVMSDSHGRVDRVKQVIEQQSEAELFIFLGDGTKDFHQAMRGVPKRTGVSAETAIILPTMNTPFLLM